MVIAVKISWIKDAADDKSFKVFKGLGLDVFDVENPEDTDEKIKELVDLNYSTIVISNELAGFSGDIIKKYSWAKNVNIIITPAKRE